MFFIGYDVGSSSVKASLLEAQTGRVAVSATSPKKELEIIAKKAGWAEQKPPPSHLYSGFSLTDKVLVGII